jgi:hypothetical protein
VSDFDIALVAGVIPASRRITKPIRWNAAMPAMWTSSLTLEADFDLTRAIVSPTNPPDGGCLSFDFNCSTLLQR